MLNFKVEGMSCGNCANTITKVIQSKYPKAKVNVDLPTQKIQIEGIEDETNITHLISQAGYSVSKISV